MKGPVVYLGKTQEELEVAFEKVRPVPHWKDPIDAKLPCSEDVDADVRELETIKIAIQYFTGSIPRIFRDGAAWCIKADGYYATIGA